MKSLRTAFLLLTTAGTLTACQLPPRFDREAVRAYPLGTGLPAGFVLGAATSSHQTEGGLDNDWTQWEQGTFPDGRPHIRDNQQSGLAARSWDLWPQDVQALESLGANGYRLSVEWSRLEPRPGEWNAAAAAKYREMLVALRAKGIQPFVTVFHFTLPRWLSDRGGWESPEALDAFAAFSRRCGTEFGDLVDGWVTLNEPNVYALFGYATGQWPPGIQDMKRATHVFATLLRAHARAAEALRASDTVDADGDGLATQIGLAHHVVLLQPASSSPLDAAIAAGSDDYANESVPRAALTGRIQLSVPGVVELDETVEGLKGSFDFLGLNYYYRIYVRADLGEVSLSHLYVPKGHTLNDLGGEVYSEGLYRTLKRYGGYPWPIYVTENGVADADDKLRPDFLRSNIYGIEQAIGDGIDVRGYFYWSLIDNFEWAEGFAGRYGLYSVDFESPERPRAARPSAEVFREAARARADAK